jgi:hypothetical protein
MARFLLAGVPRSGTSWTGEALGHAEGVGYVDEPDGFRDAFAFRVMMQHGENPALAPGDAAPDYQRLWAGAFAGGLAPSGFRGRIAQRAYRSVDTPVRQRARAGEGVAPALRIAQWFARPPEADPTLQHVLVKSVQCARSIEWIQQKFEPQVVLLFRHPLNALASWRDLGFVRNPREGAALADDARRRWGVSEPGPDAPQLAQQAFIFGVLTEALMAAAAHHPEWVVAQHETLCADASMGLRDLAGQLGLTWTERAEQFVRDSDRVGEGYATKRVASDQPDRWRERLSDTDVDVIRRVLAEFPHAALTDC